VSWCHGLIVLVGIKKLHLVPPPCFCITGLNETVRPILLCTDKQIWPVLRGWLPGFLVKVFVCVCVCVCVYIYIYIYTHTHTHTHIHTHIYTHTHIKG
jgi:hypothetical protein